MKSRLLFKALAAAGLVCAVAACGGEAEAPAETAPEGPAGITVSDGWMTMPAVAGNPGAVYFTISNASDRQATIRAADVSGAGSAMLHQTTTWNNQPDMQELFTVAVPAGGEAVFEPAGAHVMAMDLGQDLAVGGETEVTLSFVGGDKISFPVEIRAAGDDGGAATAEGAAN